jgi:predicted kinase
MRRFDETSLLSRIAETRGIDSPLAKSVADTVFAAHHLAERSTRNDARWLEDLVGSVTSHLASHLAVLPAQEVAELTAGLRNESRSVTSMLSARAAAGFLRRCHGDLHLENIMMWRGRPTLFDAIEFDEQLATIDTLYDLAFLLMDLEFRAQRTAANVVLNRYLWRSGDMRDLPGLAALPVFMAVRAGVRAMVVADRIGPKTGAARNHDSAIAHRYLRSALGYLAPSEPRLIAIGGASGTGKSTLGAALAPQIGRAPGAVHLRSDLERKTLAHAEETKRLKPEWYDQAVTAKVYQALRDKARSALAAGQSVIVDAVHGKADERSAVERVASELGVPFFGLWLSAPAEELVRRVEERQGDASDATPSVVRQQLDAFISTPPQPWIEINTAAGIVEALTKARDVLFGTDAGAG